MVQTTLGRFELSGLLGAGGMGEVYRARDPTLGRDVAIKCLPAAFSADRLRLARFEQEARAASTLNHPNIVIIHEVGESEGQHFIVMELVEGVDVRNLLTTRPLPVNRALDIAAQVAHGLAKAHAAGIVHRDLKPENLMVTADGLVKILDFGLAKLSAAPEPEREGYPVIDSHSETLSHGVVPNTAFGAVLGSPGYMAPEQAKAERVDFRADQFALGAILYEMLTAQRAFHRETRFQTLAAIIEDDPEPVGILNPAVPEPVRWIVERCLAKEPGRRYASTEDLARELDQVRGHLGTLQGEPPERREPAVPSDRRTRSRAWRVVLTSGVLIGLLAGLLALTKFRDPANSLTTEPLPEHKQVAVLRFSTDSEDWQVRAFADGLVDTLTGQLTRLQKFQPSLTVVPSTDIRQAGVATPAAARSALGATLVVTGRLQRVGDRVRLNGSLVDTERARPLRSFTLDQDAAGPDLQEGVVDRLARTLELELAPDARAALLAGAANMPGAHAVYLEGRGYLQRYDDAQSVDRALTAFQRALEIDPDYPLAYAGLAEAYWRRYRLDHEPAVLELGDKAAARALRLNDLLAPVHVTLGQLASSRGDWKPAVAAFTRALALDPASADAWRELGAAYEQLRRYDEAEATYRRAIELRPGYWAGHNYLGVLLLRRGRFSEAEGELRRAASLAPDNTRALNNLAAVLIQVERYDEAVGVLDRSTRLRPTAGALGNLGTALFRRHRYADAARAMEKAVALSDRDSRLWRNLGAAYYWAEDERAKAPAAYARAAALLEKERDVNPRDAQVQIRLADCYGMAGRKAQALDTARKALLLGPQDTNVLFIAGQLHEILGERTRAVKLITRALDEGLPWSEVETSPALAALRQDPRLRERPRS
jgi:serine/threonine-protein kinase